MHSLSTFALVFSKAKGLRHQFPSWCTRLSRAPTTMPYPTLPRALGFRWGLPYLLPTPLGIPWEVSRVHHVGLQRDGVGSAFLMAPSALCGLPVPAWGTQVRPMLPSRERSVYSLSGLTFKIAFRLDWLA